MSTTTITELNELAETAANNDVLVVVDTSTDTTKKLQVSNLPDTDTTYSAGTNISIDGSNVISSTDTTYTAGSGITLTGTQFDVDTPYTTTEQTKLSGIETGATADQTGAEIKTAYEAEADTNAFTDADHTKLDGIEAGADVTDAANVTSAGALMTTTLNVNTTTTNPSATDDGYPVGSIWVNTSNDYVFVCTDSTASAAVWRVVSPPIYGG